MPGQPLRQHRSCPYQPTGHCPFRTAERTGRLLAGLPFEIAKDDHSPVAVRQQGQFQVEKVLQVAPTFLNFGWFRDRRLLGFPHASLPPGRLCFYCRLVSHAVEPVADHFPRRHRSRPANQHEKSRLKGILGIVVIAQDATADAPDHLRVAMHDRFERCLFMTAGERLQELPVRQVGPICPQYHAAETLDDLIYLACYHLNPRRTLRPLQR